MMSFSPAGPPNVDFPERKLEVLTETDIVLHFKFGVQSHEYLFTLVLITVPCSS